MELWKFNEINHMFDMELEALKNNITEIEKIKKFKLEQLSEQCIKEHGEHLSNEGLVYAFCKRCGQHL